MSIAHKRKLVKPSERERFRYQKEEEHTSTPGWKEEKKVKLPPMMSLEAAILQLDWCLATIDKGVRWGSLKLFYKAGRLYIEVL